MEKGHEFRFTPFQSEGCMRVSREEEDVMYPSCIVPTVQACGEVSSSGVASVSQVQTQQRYGPKTWRSDDQVFPSMHFFFPLMAYSKMIRPKL